MSGATAEAEDNLFYSHDEKIAFYIAGYVDNSSRVDDMIQTLYAGADKLLLHVHGYVDRSKLNEVRTEFITISRRYAQMRVFWMNTNNPPKRAFIIGEGDHKWTMDSWLKG